MYQYFRDKSAQDFMGLIPSIHFLAQTAARALCQNAQGGDVFMPVGAIRKMCPLSCSMQGVLFLDDI